MKFTKMQGIGNDFVVVNCLDHPLAEAQLPGLSRYLNDRKFGVGGDGLLLVYPSKMADYRMRMLNPDGSEAEMCGNGIRCFGKYLFDRRMVPEPQFRVETLAGVKHLRVTSRGGKAETIRVDMGQPRLRRAEIPMRGDDTPTVVAEAVKIDGRKFEVTAVSMGNPHAVVFVDDVAAFDVPRYGPQIETHRLFPQRTNVQFAQVTSSSEMTVRTWERGAGITLACGTGACASAVAGSLTERTGKRVNVHLPGGSLTIEWLGDNRVVMTGPAADVFEGTVELPAVPPDVAA